MMTLSTPHGLPVNVPETDEEDVSPKFTLGELDAALDYYRKNGYVVLDRIFSTEDTSQIRYLWEKEVKPSNAYMYRQATAQAERHIKNENGWIMNPILNLQSLNPIRFPKFRDYAVNKILAHKNLTSTFRAFTGDDPKIVQSMYFEGNSATWEHQDSYYLDSENVGTMIAAWIALEDITANAGRFFVCPGSHELNRSDQNASNNVAENHDVYISLIVETIKSNGMEIRAPKLNEGDVLLWNSWTIHGALKSSSKDRARNSMTCHLIPSKDKFLKLQTRILVLPTDQVNSAFVYRPKDQSSIKNRLILMFESYFPTVFYWIKRQAIKYLVSKNG